MSTVGFYKVNVCELYCLSMIVRRYIVPIFSVSVNRKC